MISVRQLEIFWAIIHAGSATGAAQLLGMSQPAISKMLRHTEDRLGMKLFIRKNGRLYPTAEAEILFPLIDNIFGNLETIRRAALDLKDSLSGRIKVAAIPTLASTFLPQSIEAFLKHRPRVRVGLKVLPTRQVVDRVARQQVDIGILYGPVDDASVEVVDLCATEIVCVLPKGHPLTRKNEICPEDLTDERLISVNPVSPWGLLIEQAFQSRAVPRDTVVECNHSVISYALVDAGAGVAVVEPLLSTTERFANVVVKPFRPRLEIHPQAIYRRAEPLSRLNAAFIAQVQAIAAELRLAA